MTGVPFLEHQLVDAFIAVEVAWGADLTADPATWTWTDVTTDVRIKDGIHLRHGRSDEAGFAQPAQCTLTLNNATGAYSLGGQSPNWPNVRQNTPVRVRVDPGTGAWSTLFIGYADSWQPSWNKPATVADVKLTASGILRRLSQNTNPVLSSLRRRLTTETNVVAYWPLEEGKKATVALSAFEGAPSMTVETDTVDFAADTTSFDCSVQSPVFKGGKLQGVVPAYTDTHEWQLRALVAFPENGSGMVDGQPVLTVVTDNDSMKFIDVRYTVGGGLSLVALNSSFTTVVDEGPFTFDVDGKAARVFLEMTQNGGNIDWTLGVQTPASAVADTSGVRTLTAATLGRVASVQLCATSAHSGVAIGHVVVQDAVTSIFDDFTELSAFVGEQALARFNRLCDENNVVHVVFGDGVAADSITDLMGTQEPGELLGLLREAETVDGGIVYDGLQNEGLVFWLKHVRESRGPQMTIDASQLAEPLEPVYDDADRVNRAVVTRRDGATATFEDTDGPLGTATVGVYDTSKTVPCQSDQAPAQYAGWLVHQGTADGYRYPQIELDLVATPELIPSWLSVNGPGRRIDVTGIGGVVDQLRGDTLSLDVQGFEQTITPFEWHVRMNCAPYEAWAVGKAAAESGDTGEYVLRADAERSALNEIALAGASSLVVWSDTEVWTTDPDDFPLEVEVGGIVVTVTAISAKDGLLQTFTVDPATVTKTFADGVFLVKVHNPHVLGL